MAANCAEASSTLLDVSFSRASAASMSLDMFNCARRSALSIASFASFSTFCLTSSIAASRAARASCTRLSSSSFASRSAASILFAFCSSCRFRSARRASFTATAASSFTPLRESFAASCSRSAVASRASTCDFFSESCLASSLAPLAEEFARDFLVAPRAAIKSDDAAELAESAPDLEPPEWCSRLRFGFRSRPRRFLARSRRPRSFLCLSPRLLFLPPPSFLSRPLRSFPRALLCLPPSLLVCSGLPLCRLGRLLRPPSLALEQLGLRPWGLEAASRAPVSPV
mmetsp:Transcript_34620/g.55113  ORF Transcript_34620/g.55113 Transcript_34620/m.55113 type:complete len:284 (-) Transcript_34620:503-1354(-)